MVDDSVQILSGTDVLDDATALVAGATYTVVAPGVDLARIKQQRVY